MDLFSVEVRREFDAPVERVWRAWTEPDDLRRWWGPTGFECPRAEADVRVGGRIFVTMRAPAEWGGVEQHSTWTISELEPPTLLSYVFRFADADGDPISAADAGIPAGVPDEGLHEVRLSDLGGGRTLLEMSEQGYGSLEARDMSLGGLEQCLDKMAVLVEGGGRESNRGNAGAPS
jgi:uncharacterized protein YndB with AHSA1/START domain